MRFESMAYFNYLWLIPFLIAGTVLSYRQVQKKLVKIFGSKKAQLLSASVSFTKRRWKIFLQALVLLMMILALARPQLGSRKEEVKSEGVEIMLVVDVSESMMAEDIKPNRLEQAKRELSKLIEILYGNKIGIIAFAGSATLLSPLTTDPSALKMYLDSLSPISVSTQGTSFERALDESEASFQRGGVGDNSVTRVIILASDGEDNEPGAMDKAKKLADQGIRIFGLAYGTEKGAPIPERDQFGYLRGYKKDKSGQTVLTTVNGRALEEIAKAGKGSFYYAAFGGDHIRKIEQDIQTLEKTTFESETSTQYDEKFQIFLTLALIFLMIELFLGDRKQKKGPWLGRFEAGA